MNSRSSRDPRPVDSFDDAISSVRAYARQETIGPLRGAGRWLVYGIAGALLTGVATVMFVLGVLRLVQDLGGSALDGAWSFVPHLAALVAAVVITALALSRVGGSELNKRAWESGGHDA